MNKSNHSKILKEMFGELDASIVRGSSTTQVVSMARKRVDCIDDVFSGTKTCG